MFNINNVDKVNKVELGKKQEWLSFVSRSDEAMKKKRELGRNLTVEELEVIAG